MIKVRKANERGHFDFGWLNTYHTFSFGDYYDPNNMGFRSLRVINEDFVRAGVGFPTHGHRDMEIVTYILRGGLEHKDSMGNGSVIRPGEIQRMSAGTGVMHSELNPSKEDDVHLLQIWILPEKQGIEPGYEQTFFPEEEKKGKLRLIASRGGGDGSVTIHQDAKIYATLLEEGEAVTHQLQKNRYAWIQVARGAVEVNGALLNQGDGASVSDETEIKIVGKESAEVLLFDLN
jgi:quercetin 2,3-dioxygenase